MLEYSYYQIVGGGKQMANERKIERTIQEYVPGKQVTLAHIIPNADREVFTKLGLSEASNAIGILTITPSEASIIGADIAKNLEMWRLVSWIALVDQWFSLVRYLLLNMRCNKSSKQ